MMCSKKGRPHTITTNRLAFHPNGGDGALDYV